MVLTHCGHIFHEHCLRSWESKAGSRSCPVCRASLSRNGAWHRVHLKAQQHEGSKGSIDCRNDSNEHISLPSKKGKERETDRDVLSAMAAKEEENDKPANRFKYLPPQEVEEIQQVKLRGSALGSKLDMIVRHILYLRKLHADAIFDSDENASDTVTEDPYVELPPSEAKILVYSGWMYACDVLATAFAREKIGYVRLEGTSGNISAKRKERAVIEFRENPDITVFILHAQSQAAGLVSQFR